jgi:hypothetical protein
MAVLISNDLFIITSILIEVILTYQPQQQIVISIYVGLSTIS